MDKRWSKILKNNKIESVFVGNKTQKISGRRILIKYKWKDLKNT